jgi:hypothetical protein
MFRSATEASSQKILAKIERILAKIFRRKNAPKMVGMQNTLIFKGLRTYLKNAIFSGQGP